MNNCTFIGRMTKDPVVQKKLVGGVETSVLNFYIAVDDGTGEYKKTDFIHVTAWRGAADVIAKYMTKGREIAIKGSAHLEEYTDKQTGEKRHTIGVPHPDGFEFLGKRVVNENKDSDPDIAPWETEEDK